MTAAWTVRFHCQHCMAGLHAGTEHPTLGLVCPLCLGRLDAPATASATRRRHGLGRDKLLRIAARDGWRCHLCGAPVDPDATGQTQPTLDHVLPASRGGSNSMANLKLAHSECNNARGNALLSGGPS